MGVVSLRMTLPPFWPRVVRDNVSFMLWWPVPAPRSVSLGPSRSSVEGTSSFVPSLQHSVVCITLCKMQYCEQLEYFFCCWSVFNRLRLKNKHDTKIISSSSFWSTVVGFTAKFVCPSYEMTKYNYSLLASRALCGFIDEKNAFEWDQRDFLPVGTTKYDIMTSKLTAWKWMKLFVSSHWIMVQRNSQATMFPP